MFLFLSITYPPNKHKHKQNCSPLLTSDPTCVCVTEDAELSGLRCETEADNCVGHGCLHGSMCQDQVAHYACLCPSSGGYVGERSVNHIIYICLELQDLKAVWTTRIALRCCICTKAVFVYIGENFTPV